MRARPRSYVALARDTCHGAVATALRCVPSPGGAGSSDRKTSIIPCIHIRVVRVVSDFRRVTLTGAARPRPRECQGRREVPIHGLPGSDDGHAQNAVAEMQSSRVAVSYETTAKYKDEHQSRTAKGYSGRWGDRPTSKERSEHMDGSYIMRISNMGVDQ